MSPSNSPQHYFIKLRRGNVWTYLAHKGEVADQEQARAFERLAEARIVQFNWLNAAGVDGIELEIVTK